MTAPTWDEIEAAAVAVQCSVRRPDERGALSVSAALLSTVGVQAGSSLVRAVAIDLDLDISDQVLRAMLAAAVAAIGPGV